MAKGNMLQGMARGKVGDVVFSRLNGEQISRVRNRHPNNPKSNAQLYQRAIMATVMAAYSAGQEIFNHSFEGKSVGSENQREFMRLNIKTLREVLANEVKENTASNLCKGKVTAPGVMTPVPNEFIISRGKLKNKYFGAARKTGAGDNESIVFSSPAPIQVGGVYETIAQYSVRNELKPGDCFTFVFVVLDAYSKTKYVAQVGGAQNTVFQGHFGFVRFVCKDNILSNSATAQNAKPEDIFDITTGGCGYYEPNYGFINLGTDVTVGCLVDERIGDARGPVAIGLITSRVNEDLRSNSKMTVCQSGKFGLPWNQVLEAWRAGTVTIGDSDLILEGGDEI